MHPGQRAIRFGRVTRWSHRYPARASRTLVGGEYRDALCEVDWPSGIHRPSGSGLSVISSR